MPRTTRSILLIPLVAAALFGAAGCSSIIPGTATAGDGSTPAGGGAAAPAPTDDPVEWSNQACGSMLGFFTGLVELANIDPAADPQQLIPNLSTNFGTVSDAAGAAAEGLRAVGPAPVDQGQEISDALIQSFTAIQTSLGSVRTRLDGINTSDPLAVATELQGTFTELSTSLAGSDPSTIAQQNPELAAAFEQAPNCQQIRTVIEGA